MILIIFVLIYLQLGDICPETKVALERVDSVVEENSRLANISCSNTKLSFRSSKHLEIRNEDKGQNKPTNSKFVKPIKVRNSIDICTVLAKETPGAQGDAKNKLTTENNFCFSNRSTVSVEKNLRLMKRSILFNKNDTLENSTNVYFILSFLYDIQRNNLRQACWDICDIQRNFILESTIKNELRCDLIKAYKLPSFEASGIFSSKKDNKSIILEAKMTPLQIENITPNTVSQIENETCKNNAQETGTMLPEMSERDSSTINEDKEYYADSIFENELFLSLSDKSESIIDEKAIDLLLSEEEFDDDKIILQNMNRKGKFEFISRSLSSYSVNRPLNLSDSGFDNDDYSCNQSVSSIYSSTPIDEPGDEGFLNAITTLSSRLGDLIKSCRNMNSELKVVKKDLNNIEMSMNNIHLDIETI